MIVMRHRVGERGATLVFFAFFIMFLMGAAALAIDLGMLYVARSEAQRAADAAALAGANVFTGGCSATASCETAPVQTVAAQNAIAAAQANLVANNQGSINCDLSSGSYASSSCPGIQFTDPTSSGTEPQITVTVQRTNIPLIFAKMFNVRVGSVSASATAETYPGAGLVQCPTPFLVPNCDPNPADTQGGTLLDSSCYPATAPFVKVTSTSPYASVVANPGMYTGTAPGVYGEPWTLHYAYPTVSTGPAGSVVPSQWSMAAYGNNGAATLVSYLQSCPPFAIGCGSTVQTYQGNSPVPIDNAVNDLIEHTTVNGQGQGDGPGNGQDYLNPVTNGPMQPYPNSYGNCGEPIFPFVVGSWNTKYAGDTICGQYGKSASIVMAPLYEGNTLNSGMNTVTVVGFAELFLDYSQVVPVPGNGMQETVQANVLNVMGCGTNGSTTSSGASPIPIRLIQSPN